MLSLISQLLQNRGDAYAVARDLCREAGLNVGHRTSMEIGKSYLVMTLGHHIDGTISDIEVDEYGQAIFYWFAPGSYWIEHIGEIVDNMESKQYAQHRYMPRTVKIAASSITMICDQQ